MVRDARRLPEQLIEPPGDQVRDPFSGLSKAGQGDAEWGRRGRGVGDRQKRDHLARDEAHVVGRSVTLAGKQVETCL